MEQIEQQPEEKLILLLKAKKKSVEKYFDHYIDLAKSRAKDSGFDEENLEIIKDSRQVFFYAKTLI